jgi:hypothetical protein
MSQVLATKSLPDTQVWAKATLTKSGVANESDYPNKQSSSLPKPLALDIASLEKALLMNKGEK